MKQGWSVRIEGRADRPLDPENVFERLEPHHPAVSGADGVLSTMITVDAHNPLQAIEMAHELVLTAVRPAKLVVEDIEAMTEARQERELAESNLPDLVGLAEIAEFAGTTRQRIFQMTANRGFPQALLELRSGRLWSRAAIEGYFSNREESRHGGRHVDVTKKVDITKRT